MRNGDSKGHFLSSHDLSKHHIYNIYYKMLDRCLNVDVSYFEDYGEKGITVFTHKKEVQSNVSRNFN